MANTRRRVTGAVAAGLVASAVGVGSPVAAGAGQADLAQVRAATAKYHDVATAIADGYVATDECVPGMGYHFVNFGQFGAMDPYQPDALLYAANEHGRMRLIGVEWFVVDEDQNPATHNAEIPEMFGRQFDGPMPGHEPGMPVHYDLHAYLWQGNPDGVLATWNEKIRCHAE
ncbi:MAG TPA: hypothetical protein VFZ64_04065 [Nocardioidaceae bacterium]